MADRNLAIRLSVEDASKAREFFSQLGTEGANALKAIEGASDAAGAASGRLERAYAALSNRLDPLAKAQRDLQRDTDLVRTAMAQLPAAAEAGDAQIAALNDNFAILKKRLEDAAAGHGALGGALKLNTGQMAELGHSARAVADGLAAGISPLQLMGMEAARVSQALGLTNSIFNLTNLAIAGVAAGVVAAIAIWNSYESETARLTVALKGTGDASGQTAQSMRDLARDVSASTDASRSGVLAVEGELLKFHGVGVTVFGGLTKLVVDYAAATGTTLPQAAQTLGAAFDKPTAGARQLADQLGILTAAQLVQIEDLELSGNKLAAQNILMDAANVRVKGLAEEALGPLDRALRAAGDAWDYFMGKVPPRLLNGEMTKDARDFAEQLANIAAQGGAEGVPIGAPGFSGLPARDATPPAGSKASQKQTDAYYAQEGAAATSVRQSDEAEVRRLDQLRQGLDSTAEAQRKLRDQVDAFGQAIEVAKAHGDPTEVLVRGLALSRTALATTRDATQEAAHAEADRQRVYAASEAQQAVVKAGLDAYNATLAKTHDAAQASVAQADAERAVMEARRDATEKQIDALNRGAEASLKLAGATDVGRMSLAVATAGTQAHEAAVLGRTTNEIGLKQALLDQAAAQASLDLSTKNEALRNNVDLLQAQLAAWQQGPAAVEAITAKMQAQLAADNDVAKAEAAYGQAKKIGDEDEIKRAKLLYDVAVARAAINGQLTQSALDLNRANQAAGDIHRAQEELAILTAEVDASNQSVAARRMIVDHLRAELEIKDRLGTLNSDAAKQELAIADAISLQKAKLEEINKAQQEDARIARDALQAAERPVATFLDNLLKTGQANWKQLWTDFGTEAIKVVEKIVTAKIFEPIVGSFLQSTLGLGAAGAKLSATSTGSVAQQVFDANGNSMGTVQVPSASGAAAASSGGGLSGINNIPGGSLLNGSGGGGLFSGTGAFSASSLNTWGYNNLNIGTMSPSFGPGVATEPTLGANAGGAAVPGEVPDVVSGGLGDTLGSIAGVAGSAFAVAGAAYGLAQFAQNPSLKSGTSAAAGLIAAATVLADLGPYGWIAAAVLAVVSLLLPDAHHEDAGGFSNVVLGGPGQAPTIGTQFAANGSDISGVQNMVTGQVLPFISKLAATFGPATSFQGIEVGAGFSNRGETDYTKYHPNLTAGADIIDIMDPSDPKQVDAAYTKFAEDLLASATTIDGVHGDWVKLAAQMGALGTTSKEFADNIAFIQTGYDKAIAAWQTTGNPALDAMNAKATAAGQQFHDSIVGPMDAFNAKAASLGIPLDEATKAQANYVQVLLGIKDATDGQTTATSKYQDSVATAMAQMESFRGELDRFGITAQQLDDAEKKMVENQDKAREAEIKATSNSLAGKDYLNVAQQVADSYTAAKQDAAATQGSMASANQLFLDQISHNFAGLTGAQIREVEATFSTMSDDVKNIVIPALDKLADAADKAAAAQIVRTVADSHDNATGKGYVTQLRSIDDTLSTNAASMGPAAAISLYADTIATTFASLSGPQLHDLADNIHNVASTLDGPFKDAMNRVGDQVEATAKQVDAAFAKTANDNQLGNLATGQGRDYLNSVRSLYGQYQTDMAGAQGHPGVNTDLITQAFQAQLARALSGLTAAQLQDVWSTGHGISPIVDDIIQRAIAAEKSVDADQTSIGSTQTLISTLQTNTASLQSLASSMASLAQSLRDQLTQMDLGANSPLSQLEKYQEAMAAEQDIATKAGAGDPTALGQLGKAVSDAVTADAAYNTTSNTAFAADFAKLRGDLQNGAGSAQRQADTATTALSVAQSQLDVAQQQLAALQDIAGNAGQRRVDATLAGTPAAAGGAAGGGPAAPTANDNSWQGQRVAGINWSSDIGWIETQLSAGDDSVVSAARARLKALGVPGFAGGGVVDRPTLAMVGEGGMAEAMVPLPNGRSIPVTLSGGAGGGDVVAEVRALRAELARLVGGLTRTVAFGNDGTHDRLEQVATAARQDKRSRGARWAA